MTSIFGGPPGQLGCANSNQTFVFYLDFTVTAISTESYALPADDMALVPMRSASIVVGLKESAIYEWSASGRFPKPLRLSAKCSRFRAGDLRRWLRDPTGWNPTLAVDAAARDASA